MDKETLTADIISRLPFEPIPSQQELISRLVEFLYKQDPRGAFVINGYAGTGKTSIVGALIKSLRDLKAPVVVLAPTGRAAKVASAFSGHTASTIHRCIYRGNSADPGNTKFFLAPNHRRNTLFIVDEASMIADSTNASKSLLHHLVRHVYSAPGCRLLLIGDVAQLPPVGQTESSAMNFNRLAELGLNPEGYTLDIPVRQTSKSGIVKNATNIREILFSAPKGTLPYIETKGFPDIKAVSSRYVGELISDSWAEVGKEETLIITRANWRANEFNQALRNTVMYADEPLQRGDRILIAKNDYYWSRINNLKTFIANGDTAEVTWIGAAEKAYGRYFCDVELRMTADDSIVGGKLMLRSLMSEGPTIPREEMERFYNRVMDSYEGTFSQKLKGVMEDPYYNAFQAKYAYCVTCHKAQGGEWKHVYIDMGGIDTSALDADFYRWLYTAITRATEKVFFINPPQIFLDCEYEI